MMSYHACNPIQKIPSTTLLKQENLRRGPEEQLRIKQDVYESPAFRPELN